MSSGGGTTIPEDGFTIREADKRREGYEDAVATLTQELLGLLAELKRDVPVFSGRYKGHMLAEQTIAAQVGWFATMLYNPNNIAMDISPVTTRLEMEVAAQLARMIGYDHGTSWGHLTSGGTIANFEAFWLARGLRYLPVAAAGAAAELGLALPVATADGSRADLSALSLWQLLNIPNRATLDLWDALWAAAPRADVARALGNHSLATIGYQEYSRRLAFEYGDPLPPGVVLVSATAHYSWEKIVRALGIGSNQLVHVAGGHPLPDGSRRAMGAGACARRPAAGDRRLRQRVREHRGERGGPARPGARGAQPGPSGSWE